MEIGCFANIVYAVAIIGFLLLVRIKVRLMKRSKTKQKTVFNGIIHLICITKQKLSGVGLNSFWRSGVLTKRADIPLQAMELELFPFKLGYRPSRFIVGALNHKDFSNN